MFAGCRAQLGPEIVSFKRIGYADSGGKEIETRSIGLGKVRRDKVALPSLLLVGNERWHLSSFALNLSLFIVGDWK